MKAITWESERLLYRPVVKQDIHALFKIYGDPQTHTFNPRGPYPSIEYAQQALNRRLDGQRENGFDDWAISTKLEPEIVIGFGGVFVSQFNGRVTNNLGYRFEPTAWGKGYATELSKRAIRYGFEEVGLKEIVGVVRENHRASQRVLEKSGMKFLERVSAPDDPPASLMFSITYEQWLAAEFNHFANVKR